MLGFFSTVVVVVVALRLVVVVIVRLDMRPDDLEDRCGLFDLGLRELRSLNLVGIVLVVRLVDIGVGRLVDLVDLIGLVVELVELVAVGVAFTLEQRETRQRRRGRDARGLAAGSQSRTDCQGDKCERRDAGGDDPAVARVAELAHSGLLHLVCGLSREAESDRQISRRATLTKVRRTSSTPVRTSPHSSSRRGAAIAVTPRRRRFDLPTSPS